MSATLPTDGAVDDSVPAVAAGDSVNRWRLADVAWVEEDDDIVVLATTEPLARPLRLSGSAASCWHAVTAASHTFTASEIVCTLFPTGHPVLKYYPGNILAEVESLCAALQDAGVLIRVDGHPRTTGTLS